MDLLNDYGSQSEDEQQDNKRARVNVAPDVGIAVRIKGLIDACSHPP
jgi:hypothetical protein